MSCTTCNSKSGSPKGCKNNGVCGTDGCNKLNVFNWLSNLNPISTDSPNYYEVRFKNGRKEFYTNDSDLDLNIGDTKLGQGRDSVKNLLKDNPELCEELEKKISEVLNSDKG